MVHLPVYTYTRLERALLMAYLELSRADLTTRSKLDIELSRTLLKSLHFAVYRTMDADKVKAFRCREFV